MILHHKIFGKGEPLIILHGLFGMLDNWRSIAKVLEENYQCILVDLRNHGKSPKADDISYSLMAEDVFQLMDSMHIDTAFVMGHSMGGKVAMQMALMQPERVRKLIVVDISPGPYPHHHHNELSAIAAVDPAKITERDDAEEIFRSYLDDEGTIQFLMKNLSRQPEGVYEWKANMPVLIDHYDNLMKAIESSASFQGPVLFIKGARSTSVKDQDLPLIRTLFPHAELISIDDAGQWVHADKPAARIDSVLTFLDAN